MWNNIEKQMRLGMINCFGGSPSYPPPPPPPPPPTINDAEVEAALKRERELARKRKGRSSTVLTQHFMTGEPTEKTLLGG